MTSSSSSRFYPCFMFCPTLRFFGAWAVFTFLLSFFLEVSAVSTPVAFDAVEPLMMVKGDDRSEKKPKMRQSPIFRKENQKLSSQSTSLENDTNQAYAGLQVAAVPVHTKDVNKFIGHEKEAANKVFHLLEHVSGEVDKACVHIRSMISQIQSHIASAKDKGIEQGLMAKLKETAQKIGVSNPTFQTYATECDKLKESLTKYRNFVQENNNL